MSAHSGSLLPMLRHLPASLPVEGTVRLELQDGVPILRASTAVQRRIIALLRKQKRGTLSADEMTELDQYEDLNDYLSLLNRLVRNSLQGSKVWGIARVPRRRSLPHKMRVQVRHRARRASSMAEPLSYMERRLMIDKCLTEVSLFAKELCPTATVEATLTSYEDEDGHVRIYPPAGLTDSQIEELEGQVAGRCVDLLVETGIFLCAAVYAPDL